MFYVIFRSLFWLLTNVLCRYRVTGREHVPRRGAVLIVANHLVWYDPALLAVVFPRRLWFMAKREVFRMPVVGLGARLTGQISVRRGRSDRSAIEQALDYLHKGRAVLIFPEGTVARQDHLLTAHTGAAMLALRSGAPILPVAHTGTRHVFVKRNAWLPRVEVQIGEPYMPCIPGSASRKDALRAITEELMKRIALMVPPAERGAYASFLKESPDGPTVAEEPQDSSATSVAGETTDA